MEIKAENVEPMELKHMKKENLSEARKQFDKERADAETAEALNRLRTVQDNLDSIDRNIKRLNEERIEHDKVKKTVK